MTRACTRRRTQLITIAFTIAVTIVAFTNPIIARTPWTGTPGSVYDVVNRKGELVMQVEIDASRRIVWCGVTSVYVLRLDTNGVYHLERYPWPSA